MKKSSSTPNSQQTSLSEQIRSCRDGAVNNPYQGKDKKVLFVCSMGILRSATGARLYAHKYNTRCAGTWDDALITITQRLIDWADEIVFVTKKNYEDAWMKFRMNGKDVKILNIPDDYEHMDKKMQEAFYEQYEPIT